MFIDLLDDYVAQLQDRNTWNTTQDQNWIFSDEQWTMKVESKQNNRMKQKSNKRWTKDEWIIEQQQNKLNNNNKTKQDEYSQDRFPAIH
jgi:hypothetical protein